MHSTRFNFFPYHLSTKLKKQDFLFFSSNIPKRPESDNKVWLIYIFIIYYIQKLYYDTWLYKNSNMLVFLTKTVSYWTD